MGLGVSNDSLLTVVADTEAQRVPTQNQSSCWSAAMMDNKEWRKFKLGKTIIEATKPISITVTPRDVAVGRPGEENFCVLAQATKRSLGEFADEAVFRRTTAYVSLGNVIRRYIIRDRAIGRAIVDYDRTKVWRLPKRLVIHLSPPCLSQRLDTLKNRWANGRPPASSFIRSSIRRPKIPMTRHMVIRSQA